MGRYRPPTPEASKYITPEGKKKLIEEHDFLWKKKRPGIVKKVSAAAAEGDRSENAEYIYGKKMLREIDSKVRFLRKRLDGIIVVDTIPQDQDKVYFGCWINLEDESEKVYEYRIVGSDECDPAKGWISIDSPMAKCLLKKQVGDEVVVKSPKGDVIYYILDIRYKAN